MTTGTFLSMNEGKLSPAASPCSLGQDLEKERHLDCWALLHIMTPHQQPQQQLARRGPTGQFAGGTVCSWLYSNVSSNALVGAAVGGDGAAASQREPITYLR